jgi:hypothetical protein
MMTGDRFQKFHKLLLLSTGLLLPACNREAHVADKSPPNGIEDVFREEAVSNKASSTAPKGKQRKNGPVELKSQQIENNKTSKTQAISFDDIKLEMKKDDLFNSSMLTKKITDYDGKKIKIRGYILPSFKQDGLTQFVLVRDNMECCFGPGAAIYDCVMIQMQAGKSTSFSVRPVTVEGDFKIDEWEDFDGVIRAIYHLDGESVY